MFGYLNIFCSSLLLALFLQVAHGKTAEDFLQGARLHAAAHQPVTLYATIHGGEQTIPLTFVLGKNSLQYQFHDPEETLLFNLQPSSSSLRLLKTGLSSSLDNERRYQEFRGTGLNYDDLALGFLYWKNPHIISKEMVRGLRTVVIELTAPSLSKTNLSIPDRNIRLWIDADHDTLLRMESHDEEGKLLKRFEVLSAQKINGFWMLKEMRFEIFDPKKGEVTKRRYLTMSREDQSTSAPSPNISPK